MVRVHYDEGVANHIDPESCAVSREGIGEALTGERIGQPSSRERGNISGADTVLFVEGNTEGHVNRECPEDPAWSQNLACADAPCLWEPGELAFDRSVNGRRSASGR